MNYFLVYLLIEVLVSVNISSQIGGFNTFLEIIGTAVVGIMLLANFRVTFFESIQALQRRAITMSEFKKLNAFSLLGALFLMLPGFFSDIVGVFLQFSFFATLFASKVLHVKDKKNGIDTYYKQTREKSDDIIDVEVIDEHTDKH